MEHLRLKNDIIICEAKKCGNFAKYFSVSIKAYLCEDCALKLTNGTKNNLRLIIQDDILNYGEDNENL